MDPGSMNGVVFTWKVYRTRTILITSLHFIVIKKIVGKKLTDNIRSVTRFVKHM